MKKFVSIALTIAFAVGLGFFPALPPVHAQQAGSTLSRVAGRYVASNYALWRGSVVAGINAAATAAITVTNPPALPDGRNFIPYVVGEPLNVDGDTETLTAVAAVTCPSNAVGSAGCSQVTAAWAAAHPGGTNDVASGTYGLQEAIDDAAGYANGGTTGYGGIVVVDNPSITNAIISAALPFATVSIEDDRQGPPQFWNLAPANTTVLTTPTALTAAAACTASAQACSDPTVVGSASWGGTVYVAISCVDVMGQESIASTTISWTSVASKAIDIGNPAAVTGCVGWKPYLSLSGGSYALAYDIPLLTQPTVLLAIPVSASVCVLTTIETITPACAIKNATYGEAASTTGAGTGASGLFKGGAVVTGYPVVTSELAPNLDSASAQSLNPSNGGMQSYAYVPSSRVGIPGIVSSYMSFPITTAAQTLIGQVMGTIDLPANFMNYAGRTIEICGMMSKTGTVADTITNIQLWWDAEGSNVTAGTAVQLSNIQDTATLTAAANFTFCQDITTTVASASATGGTIVPGPGWDTFSQTAAGTIHFASTNNLFAAVGSLNLALPARIEIVYNHTTGTDGAGVVLLNPTIKIL